MDKFKQELSCSSNFVLHCPYSSQSLKQMSAELMIKTGIIDELKTELNGKQQRLIRLQLHSL